MLNIEILCTDPRHPVNPWLERWQLTNRDRAQVTIRRDWRDLSASGDFLFLISCHQIIGTKVRARFRHTLVLHASDLPKGRGMSPHVWQILAGQNRIVLSLLNAEDELDSGDIWQQIPIELNGTELHDEIHARLFDAEIQLMSWALENCDKTKPWTQHGEPSYYRKRSPADSAIDPYRPLAENFDLLRVADPERYPAFFEFRGAKYRIRIERL
jgi:methionyl-tRNA formyltransferase